MHTLPRIWAHRGARSAAPENTMAAARAAAGQKACGWELDVRLTSDKEVIVLHDDTLARTTDIAASTDPDLRATPKAGTLSLAQIQALDAGSWFAQADPFATLASGEVTRDMAGAFAGEQVPTLAQALAWSRRSGLLVNVEIKDMQGGDDETLICKTAGIIRAADMTQRVMMSSFRVATLRRFRELLPEVPMGYLVEENAFERPVAELIAALRELGASALHPCHRNLPPGAVREVREAGFDVNVWTVNTQEDILRVAREGVTGIITDFPARARAFLSAL